MPELRGILLDFYGTLVHEDDINIASITAQIHELSPYSVTISDVGRFWYESFFRLSDRSFGDSFITQRQLGVTSLIETLREFEVSLVAEVLIEQQFAHWIAPPVFPETLDFLAHLQKLGLPVCIVSNVDRVDIEAAITFHGFEFNDLVTSDDARAYKPRAEMFRIALDLLGLDNNEVVHIGDSLGSDVGGAKAVKIPVAWVNRTGKSSGSDQVADYVVGDLSELHGIVDQLV